MCYCGEIPAEHGELISEKAADSVKRKKKEDSYARPHNGR